MYLDFENIVASCELGEIDAPTFNFQDVDKPIIELWDISALPSSIET